MASLLPGHCDNASAPSLPADIVRDFGPVAVANVSDNLHRLQGTKALRPFHPGRRVIGTAVTVKTRPGDNMVLHRAFDRLRAGDVLVVDGGGDL